MSMGHVQQVGTPLELYDDPDNIFVASFIGLPPMNFFDVTVGDGVLNGKGFTVKLTDEEKNTLAAYKGKEIVLGVRPENIEEGPEVHVDVQNNENLGMNTLGKRRSQDRRQAQRLEGAQGRRRYFLLLQTEAFLR